MDAHLLRLQHMSTAYQQQHQQLLLNQRNNQNTNSRQHYSSRQQQQQLEPRTNSQQKQIHVSSSATSSGSGGEETATNNSDDRYQLSSGSSKTNSSQQAMLGHHSSNRIAHHQQQQQQQHLMHQQQKHRQAAMAAANGGHRQATLQAQTLAAGGKSSSSGVGGKQQHQTAANMADNLTSSSSDHTIDERHHLAASSSAAFGAHRLGARCHTDTASSLSSSQQSGSRFLLGVLFTLAELLLFITVFLWLYWSYQHDDGLSWQNDRRQQFNTHSALMLVGFIFLNGQAMLIYRSFQCCSKIYTKILHTILFVLATSAISLGLILGYTAQENVGANNKPIMHFYSLHAWCGLATVGLFVFQFVFGFISFLILLCCDQATSKFRAALLPIHKTFGLIIFSLAIATCLMGLLQTARSRLR